MAKAPPSIAATSTLAMVRTAQGRGVQTADLLAQAGLTLAWLENPDARLPGPTALGLWHALRQRCADPALQLAAPSTLPFGAYRVIDYLVAAAATVGEGIGHFVRFFGLIADAIDLNVDQDRDGYCLCLSLANGAPVPPVYVDYVFAALVSRIRMRIKPDLRVRQVQFRQPEPPARAPYAELFGAPVFFGADADQLFFSAAEWHAPTAGADAALAQVLEEHARILAQQLQPAPSSFGTEVQQAIAAAPAAGGSAAKVAKALHISVRTLQRKLVETGATFREVSDLVRGQLAEGYLADPQVSIAEVALLLGFSDQSSFNRAFRRWTGQSPGRWRQRRGRNPLAAPGAGS